jgi:hypothetical protein
MLKHLKPFFILLILALMVSACNLLPVSTSQPLPQAAEPATATAADLPAPTATPNPPTPTAPPTPTMTPMPVGITRDILRNMEYTLPYSQKTVKLVDGSYQAGAGADALEVKLTDAIAQGDLNGDHTPDAAVILSENMGGSGVFMSVVVVLNQNGKPVQAAATQLGDREQVNTITINGQWIILDMIVHGPNDPMCCPSQPKTQTYTLASYSLVLTHLTSKTPNGDMRAITIENPAAGAQVGDSLQVKGSVTIAPFENTLAYRLTDAAGDLIGEGPLNVTAADMGGPGTFDSAIDLTKAPAGSTMRLSILDLSAADGSVLAMDSVELTRQ